MKAGLRWRWVVVAALAVLSLSLPLQAREAVPLAEDPVVEQRLNNIFVFIVCTRVVQWQPAIFGSLFHGLDVRLEQRLNHL
jgi:hypothetical protein